MLFADPDGVQGNVVSPGVNELIIPNYKQTWAAIRKLSDAAEAVRHLSFKSFDYRTLCKLPTFLLQMPTSEPWHRANARGRLAAITWYWCAVLVRIFAAPAQVGCWHIAIESKCPL
jgi:hypothetical protein